MIRRTLQDDLLNIMENGLRTELELDIIKIMESNNLIPKQSDWVNEMKEPRNFQILCSELEKAGLVFNCPGCYFSKLRFEKGGHKCDFK